MTTESVSDAVVINHSILENDVNENDADPKVVVRRSSKGMQELSFVSMMTEGFRNKPSFGLRTCNHLLLSLDGRDKVTKLLQYLCRLLVWWCQQLPNVTPSSNNKLFMVGQLSKVFIAERFASMKNTLATSRKAFRLGRSMIEVQKIQSLGILQWIDMYLKSIGSTDTSYSEYVVTDSAKSTTNKLLLQPLRTILHSMIHPSVIDTTPPKVLQTNSTSVPFWNIAGNSIKSLGLLIFWAADNMSFLYQIGFLDDYQTDSNDRIYKRSRQIAMSTNIANRSYFIAAIAGLITNWKSYCNYTTKQWMESKNNVVTSESNSEMYVDAKIAVQKAQEKQFVLFVALVKSICDVFVVSNNSGVDLWKKYCGRPLHEGLHCLCGIISASVVLYNNYPCISELE